MISHAECGQMFKASQRKNSKTLHTNYQLFSEFVECICFISFYYYEKPEHKEKGGKSYLSRIQNLVKWLSTRSF